MSNSRGVERQSLSKKNNAQDDEPGVYSQLFACTILMHGPWVFSTLLGKDFLLLAK